MKPIGYVRALHIFREYLIADSDVGQGDAVTESGTRQVGFIPDSDVGQVDATPDSSVGEVDCEAGLGICGDRYGKGGSRQLSLMVSRFSGHLPSDLQDGFCFRKFKANINIKALSTDLHFNPNTILRMGTTSIQIATSSKKCHGPSCSIFYQHEKCPARSAFYFGEVLQSGQITLGDVCYVVEEVV